MRRRNAFVLASAAAITWACGGASSPTGPSPSGAAVLVGAGDISVCGTVGAAETATLLDRIEGTIFTAGDNAYLHGTAQEFSACYDPTWGRHKSRTRPQAGNHDYESPGAAPYFAYFGASGGVPGLGYYSFSVGAWHVVSLNSNIPADDGSAQMAWLKSDLAGNPSTCLAAIWHYPLFSSGPNPIEHAMRDVWRTLEQAGAEFVVNGHDHIYERFAPQDVNGRATSSGIREFVVGTGGATHYAVGSVMPNSEVQASVWGVIKFTLRPDGYDWEFVPVAGETFRDAGSDICH
jgi:calcineurin-like phosphoesterase family protein